MHSFSIKTNLKELQYYDVENENCETVICLTETDFKKLMKTLEDLNDAVIEISEKQNILCIPSK